MIKLWLDDERDPRKFPGWEDAIWARTPESAIELLRTGLVCAVSLDNDLGLPDDEDGRPREGYVVAEWIERRAASLDGDWAPPAIMNAHAANPSARRRIEAAFESVRRMIRSDQG